jgi:hypothetical protein
VRQATRAARERRLAWGDREGGRARDGRREGGGRGGTAAASAAAAGTGGPEVVEAVGARGRVGRVPGPAHGGGEPVAVRRPGVVQHDGGAPPRRAPALLRRHRHLPRQRLRVQPPGPYTAPSPVFSPVPMSWALLPLISRAARVERFLGWRKAISIAALRLHTVHFSLLGVADLHLGGRHG